MQPLFFKTVMALILYSPSEVPIRGKIAGTVLQTNPNGAKLYPRASRQPTVYRSFADANQHLSAIATFWRALTPSQQAAFAAASPSFPTTDRYGYQMISSAYHLFMRLCMLWPVSTASGITSISSPYTGPPIDTPELVYNAGVFTLKAPATNLGYPFSIACYVSAPFNVSKTVAPSIERLIFTDYRYQAPFSLDVSSHISRVFGIVPTGGKIQYTIKVYFHNTPELISSVTSVIDLTQPAPVLLPFQVTPFLVGVSVRLINSSYTGALMNVVDPSTSTFFDAYPDASGWLDPAPFLANLPGVPGYVWKWYSQTDNSMSKFFTASTMIRFKIWDGADFTRDSQGNIALESNPSGSGGFIGSNPMSSLLGGTAGLSFLLFGDLIRKPPRSGFWEIYDLTEGGYAMAFLVYVDEVQCFITSTPPPVSMVEVSPYKPNGNVPSLTSIFFRATDDVFNGFDNFDLLLTSPTAAPIKVFPYNMYTKPKFLDSDFTPLGVNGHVSEFIYLPTFPDSLTTKYQESVLSAYQIP